MEPTQQQILNCLREAVALIQANGLNKGHYIDLNAPADVPAEMCALDPVGALRVVACGDPVEEGNDLANAAIDALSPYVDSSVHDRDPVERIADWADQPERTADDVVALMREVAERLPLLPGALLEQRHQLDPQDSAYRHIPLECPDRVEAYDELATAVERLEYFRGNGLGTLQDREADTPAAHLGGESS